MNILTPENKLFPMNEVPDEADDIRFGVLDYSDKEDIDYYFLPLFFLDNFSRPAADLQLGPHRIQVPLDWSILIVDKESGAIEALEIKSINDRDFDAWAYNPINGYMPSFLPISIMNVYPDVEWFVPKLKNGHMLVVPLDEGKSPTCVYLLKEINKIPDQLDITQLI